MMYEEFVQKSGLDVGRETYDKVVEYVYMNAPGTIVGNSPTAFCEWAKTVGYIAIRDMAAVLKMNSPEHVSGLATEIDRLKAIVKDLESKVGVYESLFTEGEIRDRLLSGLTTFDLMTAYGQKGVQ